MGACSSRKTLACINREDNARDDREKLEEDAKRFSGWTKGKGGNNRQENCGNWDRSQVGLIKQEGRGVGKEGTDEETRQ